MSRRRREGRCDMAESAPRKGDSAPVGRGDGIDSHSDRARLQSVLRAAPMGIGWVVDRVFQDVNDRLCEMTGYTG